jgi:alkylation response protein AidB-like acyl-CoA dehydrogenase
MGVLSGMRVLKFEAIGPGTFGTMLLASHQLAQQDLADIETASESSRLMGYFPLNEARRPGK